MLVIDAALVTIGLLSEINVSGGVTAGMGRFPRAILESSLFAKIKTCSTIIQCEELFREICERYGYNEYCICADDKVEVGEAGCKSIVASCSQETARQVELLASQFISSSPASLFEDGLPLETCLPRSNVQLTGMTGNPEELQSLILKVSTGRFDAWLAVFMGNRHPISEAELVTLQFWVTAIIRKLAEVELKKFVELVNTLTNREKECLEWTAKGKTSAEIGIILDLSEHTINNYLINACRRIKATNRSHAVYLAMRAGLIR